MLMKAATAAIAATFLTFSFAAPSWSFAVPSFDEPPTEEPETPKDPPKEDEDNIVKFKEDQKKTRTRSRPANRSLFGCGSDFYENRMSRKTGIDFAFCAPTTISREDGTNVNGCSCVQDVSSQ